MYNFCFNIVQCFVVVVVLHHRITSTSNMSSINVCKHNPIVDRVERNKRILQIHRYIINCENLLVTSNLCQVFDTKQLFCFRYMQLHLMLAYLSYCVCCLLKKLVFVFNGLATHELIIDYYSTLSLIHTTNEREKRDLSEMTFDLKVFTFRLLIKVGQCLSHFTV